MSLRLSREHGVNPCVAECFICGEAKNEIYLTGHAGESMARKLGRADGEMPRQAVFDIEPCDTCKERGIAFVEMTEESRDGKPTGCRWLLTQDAVLRLGLPAELEAHILKTRAALVSRETADLLGLHSKENGDANG